MPECFPGLELAYNCAREIIGKEAECLDAAIEVERLRSAWRPVRVRVILLAESHVWTSREETDSRVDQLDGTKTGFARFVYCLGYGEPELVTPPVKRTPTAWQYWRLLHDTVYKPTPTSHQLVLKGGNPDLHKRVKSKLELLKEMRKAGIWLVDASITALYRPGASKIREKDYRRILEACWTGYVRKVLCERKPTAVLIVGRRVHSAIGDTVHQDLGRDVEIVPINQPRWATACDRLNCFDLCRRYRL